MNFLIIITHLIAFIAGIATDWLKKWSTSWFAIRDVRRAVQAEMKTLLVNLNFYILTATDEGNSDSLEYHYFSEPLFLESFEYYWQNQRDRLLMLPEWPRLKSWNEQLRQVLSADRPPLFNTIMLFEKVIIPPLDKCLDRDSKAFAKRVLARPEVDEYKKRYIRNNITGV